MCVTKCKVLDRTGFESHGVNFSSSAGGISGNTLLSDCEMPQELSEQTEATYTAR